MRVSIIAHRQGGLGSGLRRNDEQGKGPRPVWRGPPIYSQISCAT